MMHARNSGFPTRFVLTRQQARETTGAVTQPRKQISSFGVGSRIAPPTIPVDGANQINRARGEAQGADTLLFSCRVTDNLYSGRYKSNS